MKTPILALVVAVCGLSLAIGSPVGTLAHLARPGAENRVLLCPLPFGSELGKGGELPRIIDVNETGQIHQARCRRLPPGGRNSHRVDRLLK